MGDGIETAAEAEEAGVLAHGAVSTKDAAVPAAEGDALADQIAKGATAKKGPAHWAHQRLILYIRNFEATLSKDEEVAMGMTATGTGVMKIEGMGFFDPDIITFYGKDQKGVKTQLVQHVSQLNVVLKAAPKEPEVAEPRRIGFELSKGLDDDAPDAAETS